jgi:endogenous inhibitor of DNA gyrase (YacG/DUF329 family)
LIDFGRWANEEYTVAATETMPSAESAEAPEEETERQN